MLHAFVTVVIPFDSAYVNNVEAYLTTLGNPPAQNIRRVLDAGQFLHFMSMSVVRGDRAPTSHLIMEISADGTVRSALEQLADALRPQLETVLLYAGVAVPPDESLSSFLERHHCPVGQGWADIPGLNFDGTPEMSVVQIRDEARLANKIAGMIDKLPVGTALETLERVRNQLWSQENWKWAFTPAPTAILGKQPAVYTDVLEKFLSALVKISQGLLLIAAASFLILWHITDYGIGGLVMTLVLIVGAVLLALTRRELAPILPVFGSLLFNFLWLVILLDAIVFMLAWLPNGVRVAANVTFVVILGEAIIVVALVFLFGRAEARDKPDDVEPNRQSVAMFMEREGRAAQSHLAAATTLKPGRLRYFTLRLGLWIAGVLAAGFSRPGYLTEIGVIHFARWVLLPGTNKLLFLSNYDGAWQSYLEDFIVRTPGGVTMIWSNTQGFPRTRKLVLDGAADGDRLKRWIRRQQYPTLFWYTAYEHLTLTRIRTNAAIRNGISQAKSGAEAEQWLAKFGAARANPPQPAPARPRKKQPVALESDNISTLAFGSLGFLPYGAALLVTFADRARGAEWLAAVADCVSYGDCRDKHAAAVIGLSFSGLRKLGMAARDLETFPVAFQDGAAAPSRSAVLGDTGSQCPSKWEWGGRGNDVDAVMLLYWDSDDSLKTLSEKTISAAEQLGHKVHRIRFEPPRDKKTGFLEVFGFADGISQPVIRGSARALRLGREEDYHVVDPGEFILGYPNNLGYFPPSPSVSVYSDPHDVLRTVAMDPDPARAERIVPAANARHDLGHNGTYLVVRQLEQDRKALDRFLCCAAAEVEQNPRAPKHKGQDLADWLSAKMIGRWKDGTALVISPDRPVGPPADNSFLFGDDPGGANCPLGAHVRRSNPRESLDPRSLAEVDVTNRHRILRVGRPYTSQKGSDKKEGLVFMCLNSDIERQFEFIQQNWILGKTFHSLENEVDPILGAPPKESVFTIPTANGPLRITCQGAFLEENKIDSLVKVIGGGYFFIPGRRAFEYLASLRRAHKADGQRPAAREIPPLSV